MTNDLASAAEPMREAFATFASAPALFFRCENLQTGALLGAAQEIPSKLALRDYLNRWTYGE